MIISPDILRKEVVNLLGQIDLQVKEVKQVCEDLGCKPHELRDTDGNWVMVPLLLAQVQAISTMTMLNAYKDR